MLTIDVEWITKTNIQFREWLHFVNGKYFTIFARKVLIYLHYFWGMATFRLPCFPCASFDLKRQWSYLRRNGFMFVVKLSYLLMMHCKLCKSAKSIYSFLSRNEKKKDCILWICLSHNQSVNLAWNLILVRHSLSVDDNSLFTMKMSLSIYNYHMKFPSWNVGCMPNCLHKRDLTNSKQFHYSYYFVVWYCSLVCVQILIKAISCGSSILSLHLNNSLWTSFRIKILKDL